jgi:CDP-diacylglycerol--glycerol-3-phosphate 3-phosphatidyltransferase
MANIITVIRLLLVPVFLFFILTEGKNHETIALTVFLLAAATDLVDGYIARTTRQITEIGRIIDPIADWALIIAALAGLLYLNVIPIWAFACLMIRDGVLAVGHIVLRVMKKRIVHVNLFGKITNFTLMISICALLFQAAYLKTSAFIWLFYASVLLYMVSGLVYIVQQAGLISPDLKGGRT